MNNLTFKYTVNLTVIKDEDDGGYILDCLDHSYAKLSELWEESFSTEDALFAVLKKHNVVDEFEIRQQRINLLKQDMIILQNKINKLESEAIQ